MTTVAEKARSAYGDLPEGWTSRRLRFDVSLNPKKSALDMKPDEVVSFVSMDAVGEYGGMRLDENRELADVYEGYTYFADGDLCIAKITPCFENGKGALAEGLTNGVGFGTTELHVVRPGPSIDCRFLFYISIAHDFRKIGESEMYGAGGQKRIDEGFIKDWMPPLPNLETQHRIAQFLDEKTARIDGLIEKKRALLDRLAEKRQALITRAVTKGLNPDAPMKPSGIDWLGDIPAHWDVKRMKFLGRARYGLGEPPAKDDEGIPFIRATDIYRGVVDLSKVQRVDRNDVPWKRKPELRPGEILVVRSGAYTGDSALVTEELAGFIAGYDMVYTAINAISEFLAYVLLSKPMLDGQIHLARQRAAQPHLNAEELGDFITALPPLSEQRDISISLSEEISRHRHVQSQIEESIERLLEYRCALVTSAVTGQMGGLQ